MSPCLQLRKHILTLSSTLCCDWNLAQSQCWKKKKKTGGTGAATGDGAASLLEGKSEKDGCEIRNYSSAVCMGGGRKGSKVCELKDKKQITPCLGEGEGGSEVRIFLCAIIHNQFTSETLTGSFTVP